MKVTTFFKNCICLVLSIQFIFSETSWPKDSSIQQHFKNQKQNKTVSAEKLVIKLYPKIRTTTENNNIALIPINLLKSFLEYPSVLENDEIKNAPSIIQNAKNTYFSSLGDRIYVDGIQKSGRYLIYRINRDIIDPETGRLIGKEIIYNGEAETITPKAGHNNMNERYSRAILLGKKAPNFIKIPTKIAYPMIITKTLSEISKGDKLRLITDNSTEKLSFVPHPVPSNFHANIIHIFEGIDQQEIGKYQTILLNKGLKDGLDKGSVVTIYHQAPNKTWVDTS